MTEPADKSLGVEKRTENTCRRAVCCFIAFCILRTQGTPDIAMLWQPDQAHVAALLRGPASFSLHLFSSVCRVHAICMASTDAKVFLQQLCAVRISDLQHLHRLRAVRMLKHLELAARESLPARAVARDDERTRLIDKHGVRVHG